MTARTVLGLYEDLCEWAHDRHLTVSTRNQPAALGNIRKVVIAGRISVEFSAAQLPIVVVEWGDGYRGDFSHGLPSAALVGLVAGFLGEPAKETGR